MERLNIGNKQYIRHSIAPLASINVSCTSLYGIRLFKILTIPSMHLLCSPKHGVSVLPNLTRDGTSFAKFTCFPVTLFYPKIITIVIWNFK